jgi:transcriptional regulator with XRE-family HTH domain
MTTLAERLRSFQQKFDLSVEEMAKQMNVPKANLYKWMKGSRPSNPGDYNKMNDFLDQAFIDGIRQGDGEVKDGDGFSLDAKPSPDWMTLSVWFGERVRRCFTLTDDSFEPTIKLGSRVYLAGAKALQDLVWGRIYFFRQQNGDVLLRRLYPYKKDGLLALIKKEGLVVLTCDNAKKYPPLVRQLNDFIEIFRVVGSMHKM